MLGVEHGEASIHGDQLKDVVYQPHSWIGNPLTGCRAFIMVKASEHGGRESDQRLSCLFLFGATRRSSIQFMHVFREDRRYIVLANCPPSA